MFPDVIREDNTVMIEGSGEEHAAAVSTNETLALNATQGITNKAVGEENPTAVSMNETLTFIAREACYMYVGCQRACSKDGGCCCKCNGVCMFPDVIREDN